MKWRKVDESGPRRRTKKCSLPWYVHLITVFDTIEVWWWFFEHLQAECIPFERCITHCSTTKNSRVERRKTFFFCSRRYVQYREPCSFHALAHVSPSRSPSPVCWDEITSRDTSQPRLPPSFISSPGRRDPVGGNLCKNFDQSHLSSQSVHNILPLSVGSSVF